MDKNPPFLKFPSSHARLIHYNSCLEISISSRATVPFSKALLFAHYAKRILAKHSDISGERNNVAQFSYHLSHAIRFWIRWDDTRFDLVLIIIFLALPSNTCRIEFRDLPRGRAAGLPVLQISNSPFPLLPPAADRGTIA